MKQKQGRPTTGRKTKNITASVPIELAESIKAESQKQGIKFSKLVGDMLQKSAF